MVIPRLMRLDDGLTQLIFLDVNSEIDSIQNEMMNFNSFFFQHVIESISLSPIFRPASCFPCTTVSLKRCLNLKLASKKILRLKTHESEIMLCTRYVMRAVPLQHSNDDEPVMILAFVGAYLA